MKQEPHFPVLHDAIVFAARVHFGQDREGDQPLPYLHHVMDVVANLRIVGGVKDEEILCAGALHDVIEECGAKRSEIKKKFGERVAQLVTELTRTEPSSEEIKELSSQAKWELRSLMLLHEIQENQSQDAHLVKLADRLSNLRESARTRSPAKHRRYVLQSRQILEIIPRKTSPALWDAINELAKDSAVD